MSFLGFGVNDKEVVSGGDTEAYKGGRNRTDLVSLCWFWKDEDTGEYKMGPGETPKFTAAEIHYIPGKGYILDNDYLRAKLGPPKRRIATFVVHYRTDKSGALQSPFEYEVKQWTFGEDKYRQLAEIHKDFPLSHHDLKIMCTDEQFQKMTFYPSPKEALWQQKPQLKKAILDEVNAKAKRLNLGRELSIDELKEHFGDTTSAVPSSSSDVDYDDFMDGIE